MKKMNNFSSQICFFRIKNNICAFLGNRNRYKISKNYLNGCVFLDIKSVNVKLELNKLNWSDIGDK